MIQQVRGKYWSSVWENGEGRERAVRWKIGESEEAARGTRADEKGVPEEETTFYPADLTPGILLDLFCLWQFVFIFYFIIPTLGSHPLPFSSMLADFFSFLLSNVPAYHRIYKFVHYPWLKLAAREHLKKAFRREVRKVLAARSSRCIARKLVPSNV